MSSEELRELVPQDAEGALIGTRYEPVLKHFWAQEWCAMQDSLALGRVCRCPSLSGSAKVRLSGFSGI